MTAQVNTRYLAEKVTKIAQADAELRRQLKAALKAGDTELAVKLSRELVGLDGDIDKAA